MDDAHPVIVIGAGPTGLAAAAQLRRRGLPAVVLERESRVGAAVRQWGHVRLFSMWRDLVDPAAATLLDASDWQRPADDVHPTGAEWVETYLVPLAAALEATGDVRLRLDTEVIGVTRRGRDRVVDAGREDLPFVVRVRHRDGDEARFLARAVIDCSGTWGAPNPLGSDGLPALGEEAARGRVSYRVPDVALPDARARHAGRHTAVVGRGHSALTALVTLAGLAESDPRTRITWVLRRGEVGDAFGGGSADELAARGALGDRARALVDSGRVSVVTGFRTIEVRDADAGVVLVDESGTTLGPVDQVVGLTGFRPDLGFLSEIRLGLDPTLEAPTHLAPLIDPNLHSCGTVYPHGAKELGHPEPGFYLAGMKSYGRAPTFLALTGYEQVRSIAAALAGDHAAAERVELTLPETGVCGGSGLFDAEPTSENEEARCGPAPEPVTLSSPTTSL